MRLQLAVTVNESGTHDVTVSNVIVGPHTHVMTHTVHPTLRGLVSELGEKGITINDITEAFGLIYAAAYIMAVVETIASKEVPTFQAIVSREACAIHPRIASSDIDCTVEALAFVFLQNDINDACRPFSIISHRRVRYNLNALNHVTLQGT